MESMKRSAEPAGLSGPTTDEIIAGGRSRGLYYPVGTITDVAPVQSSTATGMIPTDAGALVEALADVAGMLGPAGSFTHLSRERSDEILLELLRAGRVVRGHKRVWRIAVPVELVPAARAAGGFLSDEEYSAAREAAGSRVW